MKNFYFISDLDKTLIFTENEKHICVEYNNNKPVTYMTKKALDLLLNLTNKENFIFIPCTLRSYELVTRINFINNKIPKYMICDNGARIYVDGKLDKEYDEFMKLKENEEKLNTIINLIKNYNSIKKATIATNDNAFVNVIFDKKEDSFVFYKELLKSKEKIESLDFTITNQGRKTYIIPKNISKEMAVIYLKFKYLHKDRNKKIITAGDSLIDRDFVSLGKYRFIPAHAEFNLEHVYKTKFNNILAGEEILQKIKELVN